MSDTVRHDPTYRNWFDDLIDWIYSINLGFGSTDTTAEREELSQKIASGAASDEEKARYQELTGELSPEGQEAENAELGAAVAEQVAEQYLRAANFNGPPGSVDWDDMFQAAVDLFGDEYGLSGQPREEGETDDQYRRRVLGEFFRVSDPAVTEAVVSHYADFGHTEQYLPTVTVGGVDGQTIAQARQYLLSAGASSVVVRVATRKGLDPIQFAQAVGAAQDNDVLLGPLTRRARVRHHHAPTGTVAMSTTTLEQYADRYAAGVKLYSGSHILASIYSQDPSLAKRIRENPYELSMEETARIGKMLGGWDVALKLATPQEKNWFNNLGSVQAKAGVNSAVIAEDLRSTATRWNLNLEPSQLDGLVSRLASQVTAASTGGNPWDPTPQNPLNVTDNAESLLRQSPEYGRLFAGMGPGESEEDYVSRFESFAQRFLGDVDPNAVRAGMASGDPEAVVRSAVQSGRAYESSTFQSRLASIAEAFRSMT